MSEPRRPLVVEVVGPAGAGKSVLIAALMRREPSIQPVLRLRQLRHLLPLVWSVVLLLPVLLEVYWESPRSLRTTLRYLARLQAFHHVVKQHVARPWKAVILDEGPVFTLAMLGGEPMGRRFARAWHAALDQWAQTLDAVVWLDAPIVVLAQRIRTRAKAHEVKEQDFAAIEAFLSRHRRLFDQVVSELTRGGSAQVMAFSTEHASSEEIAERLMTALEERASDGLPVARMAGMRASEP